MMGRSSVFVLVLHALVTSCSERHDWTVADLSGKYTLMQKPHSLYDRWFSNSNVSGWDYDQRYNPTIVLQSDSSFEIQGNGGGFEMPSYNGRWWISHDTITLLPWYSYYGSYDKDAEDLDGTWIEVYIIRSESVLEVCESDLLDKGRILIRRLMN